MIGQFYHYLRLRANQWKSPRKLQKMQEKQLRKLVKHAYETVPFYQELYKKNGITPQTITSLADLKKLPIITKEDIQKAANKMLSTKYQKKKLIRENTGGSTGKPLAIYRTEKSLNISRASKLRAYKANGYRLTDKTAVIAFRPIKSKWFHKWGIHRYYRIPFQNPVEEKTKMLLQIKPDVIDCYPTLLEEIGYYTQQQQLTLRPKIIFSSSEMLTQKTRKNLKRFFGVEPVDIYSTMEAKDIAWECPKHEGLHVNVDQHIIEVEEATGELLITSFVNDAMPLIRYNIGDITTYKKERCSCGRTFPLLHSITGRLNDQITLPSGRKINASIYVNGILKNYKTIKQFCLVEKKDGSLNIEIITEKKINKEKIIKQLQKEMENIPLTITTVRKIPKTALGKLTMFRREK